jgi:hypothetical protein
MGFWFFASGVIASDNLNPTPSAQAGNNYFRFSQRFVGDYL